jgi:hypothetical protein
VVIGTRGRTGGILKLVLGSVAEEVMREIDTDILAVPPPEKASGAYLPEDRLLDRPDDR